MPHPPRTGSVTSRSGKVTARRIITGVEIEGTVSDETLRNALELMDRLRSGGVSGAGGVEASEDIVTGFRYLNPQSPSREAFVAELKALQAVLAELRRQPEAAADAEMADRSLDDAIVEAEKKEPLGQLVIRRLRDTVEFITNAGKALEAADKTGPLLLKAIPTSATMPSSPGRRPLPGLPGSSTPCSSRWSS